MPNPPWMVNIAVPADLRDFIASRRIHHRQAYHEIIAAALSSSGRVTAAKLDTQKAPPAKRRPLEITRK